jgi:deazaflavin-dependent oxidoreductase (nitroreductase family)
MAETAARRLLVRTATKYLGALHRLLYRASGGRIGGRLWDLPVVLLTTTGRQSGKQRTVPLCSLRDGDDVVVIASYGGLDRPPAWWLNLEANPQAELLNGRERRTVTARNAGPEERSRLWA